VESALAGGGVAAVMVEPVQGEGGVMPLSDDFLRFLRAACDRHGALLVLDEIQCGMGRTGRLFAHQWAGIVPDIMTLAKALGCGMPIGAALARPAVAEAMGFGAHGTTFGGNPLACAVARVALRRLGSPAILGNVERQSQALRAGLAAIDAELGLFREVRGRGLMLGAVLKADFAGRAGEVLDHAAEAGLLLLQAGPDVLRLVPPLNLTDEDTAEGLARLRIALARFVA
jgi:acetylornithine/N-succinyldiaminopimelate aminotransferase